MENKPLISNDHYMGQNDVKSYEHWPLSERFADIFLILVIVIGNIIAVASGAYPVGMGIAIIIFALLFSAILAYRPSRHIISIENGVVTYQQYRFLGFRLSDTKTFPLKDIGSIVLDTNFQCDCCNIKRCCTSWLGIYATIGVPQPNQPVQIAFEIPLIYNGWSTDAFRRCMISCYISSFRQLTHLLDFRICPADSYAQKTTVIGGTWAWNMTQTMQSNLDDALANYDNFVSINSLVAQQGMYRVSKGFDQHRTVYYLTPAAAVV